MADILLDNQANPSTPSAGQFLIWPNSTSKLLMGMSDTGDAQTLGGIDNQSTSNQTGFAADTYLAGSNLTLPPGNPRIGTKYRLRFDMVKTAAGTAAATVIVRYGTAGTTADTARLTFTWGAGTAAIDTGIFEVFAHWRSVGASSVLVGMCRVTHHLAATGLVATGASGTGILLVTSGAFDSTVANSIIGVSFNGGASFSGTNTVVQAELDKT